MLVVVIAAGLEDQIVLANQYFLQGPVLLMPTRTNRTRGNCEKVVSMGSVEHSLDPLVEKPRKWTLLVATVLAGEATSFLCIQVVKESCWQSLRGRKPDHLQIACEVEAPRARHSKCS